MKPDFLKLKFLEDQNVQEISKYLQSNHDSNWQDGLLTFVGDPNTKKNKQLRNQIFKQKISDIVTQSLSSNKEYSRYTYPKHIQDFLVTRTDIGGYYNPHNDIGLNGHYSTTIFLSDPNSYEGGELCLYLNGEEEKIKLDPGYGVVYKTGIPHRVSKVLSGQRDVIIFWTISYFKDPFISELYYDLAGISFNSDDLNIITTHSDFETIMQQNSFKLNGILNNLIRRYADI